MHKLFPGKIFFFTWSAVAVLCSRAPQPRGCCWWGGEGGCDGFCPPTMPHGFWSPGGRHRTKGGGWKPLAWPPPQTPVSVYMPGSLQFTAPPLCAMRVRAATWGLSPSWDPPVPLLLPSWALQGSGKGGGVTGGLFLIVASPRAILQAGLPACCSFLTLIPAMGGFGMGSRWGTGRAGA